MRLLMELLADMDEETQTQSCLASQILTIITQLS
jgi:hypothetical protein